MQRRMFLRFTVGALAFIAPTIHAIAGLAPVATEGSWINIDGMRCRVIESDATGIWFDPGEDSPNVVHQPYSRRVGDKDQKWMLQGNDWRLS